ncbi:MAG: hypothetical protein NTW16_06830 [Bacteroidetes bacterium]|nr:hypothetical protein [Bacteroidota bacterium]
MKQFIPFILFFIFSSTLSNSVRTDYSTINAKPARDFLTSEFDSIDVIILGEFHRIREYPLFVASMIPILHKNGINILFSEFALLEDSKLIDSLISGKTYNEQLAVKIQHNNLWNWAYKEYIDIYFAAWKVNHALKKGEEHFKIIGLDRKDYGDVDNDMAFARTVIDNSIVIQRKALVYCGIHHAFSNFNHPYVIKGRVEGYVSNRMGNILYRKYPDKIRTVIMHGPWSTKESFPYAGMPPFVKRIDSIANRLPGNPGAFGVNTSESILGELKDDSSFYCQGYNSMTLKKYCQGYIFLQPICKLSPVIQLPNFINNSNLEETRKKANMGNLSIQAFNDSIKMWLEQESKDLIDIKRRTCN